MNLILKVVTSLILINLSACASQAKALRPALLVNASAETHLLIEQSVAKLFNGQQIPLAEHAFTEKSTVLIERNNRSANGQMVQGRVVDLPQSVTLLSDGQQCFLKHNQADSQLLVNGIECK